jgi:rubrerythrin
MADEELLKWIRFAIELEEKGLNYYKECRQKVRHPMGMELFDFLVKAETGHKTALTGLLKALSNDDPMRISKAAEDFLKMNAKIPLFDRESLERVTGYNASLHDMFNTAIRMEEEGIELYSDLAKKEKNPELKKMFARLMNDEKFHKKELVSMGEFVFGVQPTEEML